MRVRFAPSPTGALHIGGARTALFNWLLARHASGRLVLRIEDTDRERSSEENVEQILDALRWLELDWDEGPVFQSEREARHREAVASLLESGRAYRSRSTAEDVRSWKAVHGDDRGFRGEAHPSGAVRLRVPDEGDTVFVDLVLGEVRSPNRSMDDLVIARADGTPLYNLAVAVDDLDLEITDVIRGNDHLTNTAKQLMVIRALGGTRRVTGICRCCTVPTARSSRNAMARPRSRSYAPPATCPRRCATTSRCSAGGPATTRRSSRRPSSSAVSTSPGCSATRPSSTRRSCAG